MSKKNRLLQTMSQLPMTMGDKLEFVNVILEEDAGGGTGGSGGEVLEGEYYLARPSEWYWKIPAAWHHDNGFLRPDTDDYTNYTAIYTLGVDPLMYAYESVVCVENAQYRKYDIIYSARNSIEQHFRESMGDKIVFPVCAFRETKNSEGIDGVCVDSMVEELSIFTGEPEDVIIDFFASVGLLRITKEEYESVTTE